MNVIVMLTLLNAYSAWGTLLVSEHILYHLQQSYEIDKDNMIFLRLHKWLIVELGVRHEQSDYLAYTYNHYNH